MSFERDIIKRLHESRRVNEDWHPALNKMSKGARDIIRREFSRIGIDIENTPANVVEITNGRDPRLKGRNIVIFEVGNHEIAIWGNGKAIYDGTYIYEKGKSLLKLSWSDILKYATKIISMEFDADKAKAMAQKQKDRAESKKGMVQRFTQKTKPRYATIDKSGYIVDPNKYKNMFAELNISNSEKILADAKDVYVKLANNLDKIDWDKDNRSFDNYDYIMRSLMNSFRDLTVYLKKYEAEKAKYGVIEENWYKGSVTNAIKDLKDMMNKAKRYL